jgi:hypothetical protein
VGEAAVGHGGADVGGVARPIEEMGVDVEGDRCACVAEDAADLADVEAQVDDEVAGEGVAEVVEAKRRSPRPSRRLRLTAWATASVSAAVATYCDARAHAERRFGLALARDAAP